MSRLANNRSRILLSLGIALLILLAYEGVRHCGFVEFDDDLYVYGNPWVRRGLTWAGLRWAFAADLLFESPYADYWMPVPIVTRMLDVEAFGLNAAGHHATNVLLHALHAVLVFLMLDGLTGARYRSAFAAAMLAVHPLTVESVAWVTERKDVLSGVLWTLAILAYGRYVTRCSRAAYASALLLMLLGLMTKPIVVVLPMVLLVLDFWPLGRLRCPSRIRPLLVEKAPFFALATASAALTVLAHSRGGHLASVDALPLATRLANAFWSVAVYLGKTLWPTNLAVFYPYPLGGLAAWRTALSVGLLGGISWLAVGNARSRPYFVAGWLWLLLCLAPVLGIIQTGQQARADRFMYLPLVGAGILAAWGGAELASVARPLRGAVIGVALGALCAWVLLTRAQVRRWESTLTLFSHAVAVTDGNYLAHSNLATGLARQGDLAAAERHYREAIRIRPGYWQARTGLGVVLMRQGRLAEALEQQGEALRSNPASADVYFNLGALEARMGRSGDAASHYAEALRLNPGLGAAHYNWGNLLVAAGRLAEAEDRFSAAVRLQPQDVEALNNLGLTIGLQGRWPQAAELLGHAVSLDPGHTRARVNLGRALKELGRLDEARAQWREAVRRNPADPASAEALEELRKLEPGVQPP